MPFVPMEIPSLTPMVLNCIPSRPALSTPSFTLWFRSIRCMLHGLPEYHTELMPTCALFMSASLIPVAYSMACDAPCDLGCVMCLLTELSSLSALAVRAAELESVRLQTIRLGSRFRGQKNLRCVPLRPRRAPCARENSSKACERHCGGLTARSVADCSS